MSEKKQKPYITIALIVVNCLVFLILSFLGNTNSSAFMAEHGAIYPPLILEEGEYWRLFTAMFLHFGARHLLNNMVLLGAAGSILEEAMGRGRFLLLYLLCGLGSSALSLFHMVKSGDYAVSAGASGAIFGIIGGLLIVVLLHRGRYQKLTKKGMLVMIALALYYGISTSGVDNWGHVGGLVSGLVLTLLLYRKRS